MLTRTAHRFFSVVQPTYKASGRISAQEYAERRQRLVECVKRVAGQADRDLVILLKGARRHYIAPDVPGTYRQCSHFRYLSGVVVPNCYYLVHAPRGGASVQTVLFMDKRSDYDKLWEGALPIESSLEQTAAFVDLLPTGKIFEVLAKMASSNASLFFESSEWQGSEIGALRTRYGSYHGVKNYIDTLRLVKSSSEIQAMRDVCTIGSQVVSSTISGSRGFGHEAAIVGLLEFEARRRGAEMLAYPPVVAAGERANTIHYLDANQHIEESDCVLMDAGCDLNGYVSDITRTYPISGQFTAAQRTLYDALRHVHEQLLVFASNLEKVRLSHIYSRMVELIASVSLEIGLLPQSTDEKKLLHDSELLCPHHVSHYLGMDVHDCTSISRDIDVPPGTVFTIEPGIYIPKASTYPEEFCGVGMRIEDDVLARNDGIEVLTQTVPHNADEIEYLMRSQ